MSGPMLSAVPKRRVQRFAGLWCVLWVGVGGCGDTEAPPQSGQNGSRESASQSRPKVTGLHAARGEDPSEARTSLISGSVESVAGAAVAGAEVLLWSADGQQLRTDVDAAGRFSVGPFEPGEVVPMQARAAGIGFSKVERVPAPSSGIVLVLQRGGVLRGSVASEAGSPVAAFDVRAEYASGWEEDAIERRFQGGAYVLGPVDAEWVELVFTAEGYLERRFRWGTIAKGEFTDLPETVLSASRQQAGTVVDALSQRPLVGALVRTDVAAVRSDQEGRFSVALGEAGTLQVSAAGHASESVASVGRAEPLVIGLARGGAIRGLLTAGGMHVAGSVSLFRVDPPGPPLEVVEADGTGVVSFAFDNILAGHHRLVARAVGYAGKTVDVLVKDREEEWLEIDVLDGDVGSIRGYVTGLHGGESAAIMLVRGERADDALSGVGIQPSTTDRSAHRQAHVHDDSSYLFTEVAADRYRLVLQTNRGRQVTKSVRIGLEKDLQVDFVLGNNSISGTVRRNGVVWDACRCIVRARPTAGSGATAVSDVLADGEYRINGLDTACYSVDLMEFADEKQAPSLVVHEMGEVNVDGSTFFDVDVASFMLAGRVEAGDRSLAEAVVAIASAAEANAARYTTFSALDGTFSFSGMKPGRYSIWAHKSGYELRQSEVGFPVPVARNLRLHLATDMNHPVRIVSNEPVTQVGLLVPPGIRLRIDLGTDGVGFVPSSLLGKDLTFGRSGHTPLTVPRWGGEPLALEFERR